ncbi:ATP-binding protein [Umezawaea endophytica]|uniref:ATP-binding protein n=1 Tax=Umezawaea endophytica TaxID=1654476 RepID=A0A9X2VRJ0_9PSEU|nr:ATP-binding protein [Umezawaea endophytica]MCS7481339.1 ATP-binding protein [Umezawaea endophytica]
MITLGLTPEEGATVVEATGRLDLSSYAEFRDGLLKCAVTEPTAIIVHLLDGFEASGTAELSVFATVWMRVSEWPGVPVMVVADDLMRTTLTLSGIARFVPQYPTVRLALDAIGAPRTRRRHEVQLPFSSATPRLARGFVRDTCERWGVPEILDQAVLVVSELVENAVQHTGSAPSLRLELRPGQFAVAVHDEDPTMPKLRPLTPDQPGGRGLPLVQAVSKAWGASPSPRGGKVIWAVLPLTDGSPSSE